MACTVGPLLSGVTITTPGYPGVASTVISFLVGKLDVFRWCKGMDFWCELAPEESIMTKVPLSAEPDF